MEDKTVTKPTGPATGATPGKPDEAAELVREYGFPILVGLVVALLILGGYQLYRAHQRSVNERSLVLLNQARTTSQMQEIVNLYPSSPAAPMALLSLATQQYRNGEYEQAQQTYRQFASKYPEHPMKEIAAYGMACCLEASGLTEQALDAFAAFSQANPGHYLVPLVQLARGRCLDQLGRLEEAKSAYEDFIAANPESPWKADAESLLLSVQKDLRAGPTLSGPAAAAIMAPKPLSLNFEPVSPPSQNP